MRVITFFFLVLTASEHSTTNRYLGSWYHCDYFGQYSEIHISNNELIHNRISSDGWYNPHPYKIVNDTLVYYDTLHNWHDKQGNPSVVKIQAVLKENRMNVLWGDLDSIYSIGTFNKMPFELKRYEKNDSISYDSWLYQKFSERSEFFNCQDKRTNEEKKQDSVEMEKLLKDIF